MRRVVLLFAGVLALTASSGGAVTTVAIQETALTGEVAYTRTWHVPDVGDLSWIAVADLAGAGRHEVTQRPPRNASWIDHAPLWSPDGSRLAFVREGKADSGLYVVNREGSGLRRVLPLPNVRYPIAHLRYRTYEASDYAWSPDGLRLAVAYGPLYVVNRDGTGSRRLLAASACKPSWSPDRRSLVYLADAGCSTRRGSNGWDPGFQAVSRIDADGSHRRLLATGSFGDASWSPDGRQIAFTNDCGVAHGGDWLCSASLMRADGSGKHRLVKDAWGRGDWGVVWAAGGKEVLSPNQTIQATNVVTGKTRNVLRPAYQGNLAGISVDGQRIAVIQGATSYKTKYTHALLVVSLSGRLLTRVTVPRGWQFFDASVYLP